MSYSVIRADKHGANRSHIRSNARDRIISAVTYFVYAIFAFVCAPMDSVPCFRTSPFRTSTRIVE